jgi:hypothetical protein
MIRVTNGIKKLNHRRKVCSFLINKAKKESDNAFMHFFELIGLDKDLFEHLKKIRIVIDLDYCNDYSNIIAFYDNLGDDSRYDNSIHILPEYIDYVLNTRYRKEMFNDLVRTIIHESIHANRSIIIKDGVIYPQSFITSIKKYKEYSDKYGHLITPGNEKYNVLSVSNNKNLYNIVTYNRFTNDFDLFILPVFLCSSLSSTSEMESLLNNKPLLFNHVKSIENPYDINNTGLVSDYSTIYKSSYNLSKRDITNIESEIEKQRGFEETMTEAFTRIIFYLKDKDSLNFDELLNSKKISYDVRLAINFIHSLDIESIRWFFLSCFEEEYRNRFYEIYGEEYFKLIDKFNEAYENCIRNKKEQGNEKEIEYVRSLKKVTI